MDTPTVILIALASALVAALISRVYSLGKIHRKLNYMLDALEDKETNFHFSEEKFWYRRFNRTLNRIHILYDCERQEIAEQEQYYGQMLDQVRTGIVVIDLSRKREGQVIYSNASARNLLGLATFSHIRQLGNIHQELENAFWEVSSAHEQRNSYYNERGKITLSLTASEAMLQAKQVKIVALNDITGEMVHNEELSWNKLIRVLTHEIMNTVTPIASLSHTLSQELDSETSARSLDWKELKLGLDTIASSSDGLIKFVNTYRSLTRVSAPVKKAFFVRELIEKVQQLTRESLHQAGAVCSYVEKSEDILLYADADQLSQVLVNLVKNALQAEATKIEITAEIDYAETVVITVSNNGRPISAESQEEIFVPFYTTKPEGTGIGLSLSRQIMRLHNGTLTLGRSDKQRHCLIIALFKAVFRPRGAFDHAEAREEQNVALHFLAGVDLVVLSVAVVFIHFRIDIEPVLYTFSPIFPYVGRSIYILPPSLGYGSIQRGLQFVVEFRMNRQDACSMNCMGKLVDQDIFGMILVDLISQDILFRTSREWIFGITT